ncbi:MAG: hypothetical protein ACKOXB_15520 [Flavobacteriales bacterium]
MPLAPIVLFVYKRVDHLRRTLETLHDNVLAEKSELIVFSDGPKNPQNKEEVEAIENVRKLIKSKNWCGKVELVAYEKNQGINTNYYLSLARVFSTHDKAIVIEDDLLLSPFFLTYMNQSLDIYKNENRVMQISGYWFPVKSDPLPDTFFLQLSCSWGWATWKDRWENLIKDPKEVYNKIKAINGFPKFNLDGIYKDFEKQLTANAEEKVKDGWDICWYGTLFLSDSLVLFPSQSLVKNIGFDSSGSHYFEGGINFNVELYERCIPLEKVECIESAAARKALYNYFKKEQFGLRNKIKYKLKKIFKSA